MSNFIFFGQKSHVYVRINKNTSILFCLAPFCEKTLSATKDSLKFLAFIYKWF